MGTVTKTEPAKMPLPDLTPAERRDLELRYDGPIPAQAIADTIRLRGSRPAEPISPLPVTLDALRTHRHIAASHARRAEDEMHELIAAKANAANDAHRDRLARAIADKRRQRDELLQTVAHYDERVAQIAEPAMAAAE